MTGDLREAAQRKGSFAQTLKAVAWSFFGVRKSSDHAEDLASLNPTHVVLVGILAGVLFVIGLVLLVSWIISSGIAQ